MLVCGDLPLHQPAGLRRPHLPWAVPEETARRVPPAEAIAVARYPTAARGAPAIAYFNCLNEGKCVRALELRHQAQTQILTTSEPV